MILLGKFKFQQALSRRTPTARCLVVESEFAMLNARTWVSVLLVIAGGSVAAPLLITSCRSHTGPATSDSLPGPGGEPDRYAATLVRTVDYGESHQAAETRTARLGQMRREEWIEQGERRAAIWRPDLGKTFLLSLDRKLYVETQIYPGTDTPSTVQKTTQKSADTRAAAEPSSLDALPAWPKTGDSTAGIVPLPQANQVRTLPDRMIDAHPCKVTERRLTFPGGHAEVIRTYQARDLNGLVIRAETESDGPPPHVSSVVQLRDIRTEVSLDEFAVPPGFRKVNKL